MTAQIWKISKTDVTTLQQAHPNKALCGVENYTKHFQKEDNIEKSFNMFAAR